MAWQIPSWERTSSYSWKRHKKGNLKVKWRPKNWATKAQHWNFKRPKSKKEQPWNAWKDVRTCYKKFSVQKIARTKPFQDFSTAGSNRIAVELNEDDGYAKLTTESKDSQEDDQAHWLDWWAQQEA